MAFDLMFMLSSILDRDAQMIMESLNEISEDAAEIFLEYFSEYIEDWYVIEGLLKEKAEQRREYHEADLTRALDEAYRQLKPILNHEV